MLHPRILGLDFGNKTVGVAVSDPLFMMAQGVEIIRRQKPTKLRQTIARIEELAKQYQVEKVVLGLPLNMDDTEGPRCEATRALAAKLEERLGIPIILWDERLTTVEADEIMAETGRTSFADRKEVVDELAAMLILDDYMNYIKEKGI